MTKRCVPLCILLTLLPSLMSGCDNRPGTSDMPAVAGVEALSNHYVEIAFVSPAGPAAADPSRYTIVRPDGGSLGILGATLNAAGDRVVLATDLQSAVSYGFEVDSNGNGGLQFMGSTAEEPYLETAVALSSTEVLLTFSAQMDEATAEDERYYEIADPDGDTDIDIRVTAANLQPDGRTVMLTTTAQNNLQYTVRVTNVRRHFSCAEGGRIYLDVATQGQACAGHLRPTTSQGTSAEFVLTSRIDVNEMDMMNPGAGGAAGSVITSVNGIGVNNPECGGGSTGIDGGNDNDADEELIFTLDTVEPADNIVLGVRNLEPTSQPMLFISSEDSSDFDHVINATELKAGFAAGQTSGDIVFADLSLPADLKIDAFKIREGNRTLWVDSVCGISTGGRLIDPTHNSAVFYGIPPTDMTGPTIVSAVSTDDTTVIVSFSEPLSSDASDPTHFRVCIPTNDTCAPDAKDLVVVDAWLTEYDTQIILTTVPQSAGATYMVIASGITDKSGNNVAAPADANSAQFAFSGAPATLGASALPRVVGAASTSNTSVLVTFNKPMGDSALNASNYIIVVQNVQAEAAGLTVTDATSPVFVTDTSVALTTLPQSQVEYLLTAINVLDTSGNQLAPRTPLVDPTTAIFWGTGVSGAVVDTDGDGLPDDEEQLGWVVNVTLSSGEIIQRDVTSDPYLADTDLDGLNDLQEQRRASDPRDQDTDADLIPDGTEFSSYFTSLTNQDTDGDGLNDFQEVDLFRTSPIFDDSDGDGLPDNEEVVVLNRNPLIADLPRPRIDIGNMDLRLDTRFSFTDTQGQSQTVQESSGTSLSEGQTRTFSFSDSQTTAHSIEDSIEVSVEIPKKLWGVTARLGHNYSESETISLSRSSSESAQQTYQESLTTSETLDETRAVTREVVGANMQVELSIINEGDIAFSLSNLEISALQQDRVDRSRLLPMSTLSAQASDATFNLGPFVPERGPFIFDSREVFPALVEDLLKNPRGLVFRVANFDITDEFGRNFAFATQTVNDRTAGLTLDFGDGTTESYRVSTMLDCSNEPCRSFDDNSEPAGVRMGYALQGILGLQKVCALNDNDAPDDCVVIPAEAVLDGGDGACDTRILNGSDDIQVVDVGRLVGADSIVVLPGPNGILDSTPGDTDGDGISNGDDDRAGLTTGYSTLKDSNGVEFLTRIKSVEVAPAEKRGWLVLGNKFVAPTVPFDDIVLHGGDNFSLSYVQDRDEDGLYAREEYLHGSSDRLENSDGFVIIDGGNGRVDTQATGDDIQIIPHTETGLEPFTHVIGPGPNGVIDTVPGVDDQEITAGDTLSDFEEVRQGWIVYVEGRLPYRGYANPSLPDSDADGLADHEEFANGTDALKPDTDEDGLSDHAEIFDHLTDPLDSDSDDDGLTDGVELALGCSPNNSGDADLCRDTDRDGLTDSEEAAFGSDPQEPDTDGDGLPDLLEHRLGSNPDDTDSDGDGLLDYDEFDPQSSDSINLGVFRDFEDDCAAADRCSFDLGESLGYGTSVTLDDTDDDDRTDYEELFDSWVVTACEDGVPQLPNEVFSDPLNSDPDNDGLNDGGEEDHGTDPFNADTDGDLLFDGVDPIKVGCQKVVSIGIGSYITGPQVCELGSGDDAGCFNGCFTVELTVQTPTTSFSYLHPQFCVGPNQSYSLAGTWSPLPFSLAPGQSFTISGQIMERDDTGWHSAFCDNQIGDCDDDCIPIGPDARWEVLPRTFNFVDLHTHTYELVPTDDPTNASCWNNGAGHKLNLQINVVE